jgi:hypothetical protein
MCAMFGGSRDVSLVRHLNRELLGNIITQQAAFYKFKLGETKVNIYGEAAGEKYYDGPFLFNCLISREDQEYPEQEEGVNYIQGISFAFFQDDLVEANILPEVGDIILYQEGYYEVDVTVSNQYFLGKYPSYPNNNSDGTRNPLNPGLENFGSSISVVCKTHYVPADKVAISPYKERL